MHYEYMVSVKRTENGTVVDPCQHFYMLRMLCPVPILKHNQQPVDKLGRVSLRVPRASGFIDGLLSSACSATHGNQALIRGHKLTRHKGG